MPKHTDTMATIRRQAECLDILFNNRRATERIARMIDEGEGDLVCHYCGSLEDDSPGCPECREEM